MWACRSVGDYTTSAATAAAFSPSGTTLAISHDPDLVTLWEPLALHLIRTLRQPLPTTDDSLLSLHFIGDDALLAASHQAILCWEVAGTAAWTYRATAVLCTAADEHSDAAIVAVTLGAAAFADGDGEKSGYAILEFGPGGIGAAATPNGGDARLLNGAPTMAAPSRRRDAAARALGRAAPVALSYAPSEEAGGGGARPPASAPTVSFTSSAPPCRAGIAAAAAAVGDAAAAAKPSPCQVRRRSSSRSSARAR